MKMWAMRYGIAVVALGCWVAGTEREAAAQEEAHNNVRPAIKWTRSDYTCEGGAKVTVNLSDENAKVLYQGQTYLMKQTQSADGNRYSDGKVVWWGRGTGGFLQEDTPEWNGKMIVKHCQLDKPPNAEAGTGTAHENPAAQSETHNNVRRAIRWTRSEYLCEGGAKVTVDVGAEMAKVRYGDKAYLMKETESRSGQLYSDGKVLWWLREDGGLLKEDTPEGNGKVLVQGCKVAKP
jgi:membrane-bound inhibitor of C-type lysozyme